MPELPEVETVRRGMEPALLGHVFSRVTVNRFDLRGGVPADFAERLQGRRVVSMLRRGKYLLIFTDGAQAIVLHLGMSGRVRIYESAEAYSAEKHDHILFDLENGGRIVFCDPRRFGMAYLVPADAWEAEKPFCNMGPEPLGNGFHAEYLFEKLSKRKGPIKVALLDQKLVVGVGNIYACEALFRSGIAPECAANDLDADACARLVSAIRDVLNDAIASGGSSLRDYRKADGGLGYFQHHFAVYGREGEACSRDACSGVVARLVQAGRSTFYCPRCQV